MTDASIEVTVDRRELVAARQRTAVRSRSVVILGKPTETNCALAAAFADIGQRAQLAAAIPPRLRPGDLALARFDVLPTLDGVEPGLWRLTRLELLGVHVMNSSLALFAAHDKLSTALFLGRAGVEEPRTAHVREETVPAFPPPYVVKPRFGSWGRDVHSVASKTSSGSASNDSGAGAGSVATAHSCNHSSSQPAATCASSSPGAASSARWSAVPNRANGGRTSPWGRCADA